MIEKFDGITGVYTIVKQTKVIFKGKKYWTGYVLKKDDQYFTCSAHWIINSKGENGKINFSDPSLVKGKNIGKSNETSDKDQALFNIDSDYREKKKKGYSKDGKSNILTLPMTAHVYDERKGTNVRFPGYVSRKIDGCRALTDGKIFWSRQGKIIVPECVQHLLFDTGGEILDGELVLPLTDGGFEDSVSAIKKYVKGTSEKLVYKVFDIVKEDCIFEERYSLLKEMKSKFPKNVELLEQTIVFSDAEVEKLHDQFVSEGEEGAMFRNENGLYEIDHRSYDLLKVKRFKDCEFIIEDTVPGDKRPEEGLFTVKMPNGLFTRVPINGTREDRERYLSTKSENGKVWTVKYLGLTKDGRLRHPNALYRRDSTSGDGKTIDGKILKV